VRIRDAIVVPMWPKWYIYLSKRNRWPFFQIYAPHNTIDVENGSQRGSILAGLSAEHTHTAQRTGGATGSAPRPSRPAAPPVAAAEEPIGRLLIPKYLCALRDASPET